MNFGLIDGRGRGRQKQTIRRSRVSYEETIRNMLDVYSDYMTIQYYRLDKTGIEYFANRMPLSMTLGAIPNKLKLIVCLKYLATGESVRSLSLMFNLSKKTICKCIHETCEVLNSLSGEFVKFPEIIEHQNKVKADFANYSGFPGVIGAIDGTHIAIKRPRQDEHIYVNRKGFHSLNVQVVCDFTLKFTNCVVKWPGCTHDTAIWKECGLYQYVTRYMGQLSNDSWLIGDTGYPLREYLLTPFADPQTAAEEMFNDQLCKARCTIERAIGLLKSRFRTISHKMTGCINFEPEKAIQVVGAAIVLHNYCVDRRLPLPVPVPTAAATAVEAADVYSDVGRCRELDGDANQLIKGRAVRQRIVHSYMAQGNES